MESSDCIFCKIANGLIPSKKLYEDDEIIAFDDISPLAPVHFLVVPKKHIPSLNEVSKDLAPLLGHMNVVAVQLAKEKGVDKTGC
ncbi:MAG: HIT domain-containing protein, partial [Deltaproteobacteria bacterium]|nr:HIT domain-containing protein [Deltaproteobacteria bacterium]